MEYKGPDDILCMCSLFEGTFLLCAALNNVVALHIKQGIRFLYCYCRELEVSLACVTKHSMNCDESQSALINDQLLYAEAIIGNLECTLDDWCAADEGNVFNLYPSYSYYSFFIPGKDTFCLAFYLNP